MNNSFITKLTVSVVTVVALLAFLAPAKDNNNNGGDDFNYGISTYSDNDDEFDLIKYK